MNTKSNPARVLQTHYNKALPAHPTNGHKHLDVYERNIDNLERELSKRERKEAIQNARKRQSVFGCRL